jgi:hypothetical protein
MNAITYTIKYWLVFNNNNDLTDTIDFKEATADYERVLNVSNKFHTKYSEQLNLKRLSAFIATIRQMAEEPVDFDLDGLDEADLSFLYYYFRLDASYIENVKNDSLRAFAQFSSFGGIYVLVQFWQKKQGMDTNSAFNIMRDQNNLDIIRRNFNNENVLAFFLDVLNVYRHRNEPVFPSALNSLQLSLENFSYPSQSTLRKLSILSDRTIVNYFVARLEEIENPDESQKAALAKYKFYQERISAKYYKNIFTEENITWYKAWIKKNLLKSTDELDNLLPDQKEAYLFLDKKFNSTTNTFLPNLVRGTQHFNFNYTDAPNMFIYSRIYAAMCHKDLTMDLVKSTRMLSAESNLNNVDGILDRSRINIIIVEGFLKHTPTA